MRKTEPKILSRAYAQAYGANAFGALSVAIARVEGAGERSALEAAREELAQTAIEDIARCADPVRRYLARVFRNERECRDCVAAPGCPRATGL